MQLRCPPCAPPGLQCWNGSLAILIIFPWARIVCNTEYRGEGKHGAHLKLSFEKSWGKCIADARAYVAYMMPRDLVNIELVGDLREACG